VKRMALLSGFFLTALCLAWWAGGSSNPPVAAESELWEITAGCDPIDPSRVDTTYQPPLAYSLTDWRADTTAGVYWHPVDDPMVFRYRVEVCTTGVFDSLYACDLPYAPDTSSFITGLPERPLWFRVRWADSTGMYSRPSNVVTTTIDTTAPVLSTITIWGRPQADSTITRQRDVSVEFGGSDNYAGACDSIHVTEDMSFGSYVAYAISTCDSSVSFVLSGSPGRKSVWARLVDMAGNISDSAFASIESESQLHNYPNPFNPNEEATALVFGLEAPQGVTLYIYDLGGNLVLKREGISGVTGLNEIEWDGFNGQGKMVADGGYVAVVEAGNIKYRTKIAVAKRGRTGE